MKQTIFKIMLLLAVIFMRVEMAGAVSCNHAFHDAQTSSAVSNQTDADETKPSILSMRLWIKRMICSARLPTTIHSTNC